MSVHHREHGNVRTFPGGSARLPHLGLRGGGARPTARVSYVGTAFVRTPTRPADPTSPSSTTSDPIATGPTPRFAEYYTYESLFAAEEVEQPASGPTVDAEAFESLGLEPDAPWQDVVTTYRRLAKEHHPDRLADATPEELDQANERLRDLNFAYARLRALFRQGGLDDTAD
jgi:hypothetical protein